MIIKISSDRKVMIGFQKGDEILQIEVLEFILEKMAYDESKEKVREILAHFDVNPPYGDLL